MSRSRTARTAATGLATAALIALGVSAATADHSKAVGRADGTVSADAEDLTVKPGAADTQTVYLINDTAATVTDPTLVYQPPPKFAVDHDELDAACGISGDVVECRTESLDAHDDIQFAIPVQAASDAQPGTVTGSVSVKGDENSVTQFTNTVDQPCVVGAPNAAEMLNQGVDAVRLRVACATANEATTSVIKAPTLHLTCPETAQHGLMCDNQSARADAEIHGFTASVIELSLGTTEPANRAQAPYTVTYELPEGWQFRSTPAVCMSIRDSRNLARHLTCDLRSGWVDRAGGSYLQGWAFRLDIALTQAAIGTQQGKVTVSRPDGQTLTATNWPLVVFASGSPPRLDFDGTVLTEDYK